MGGAVWRDLDVESIEKVFKAMGLNELPNRMSRGREEDKALNHLALNVTRSGREGNSRAHQE